ALNPEDPDNIVVGAHDSRDRPYEAWYYTSIDGGETWIEGSLPGIESIYLLSDPSLAFGLDDTVYYATIATESVDLNITPDSGPIGTNVEIKATGFNPFSTVLIMFDDENLGFKITNAVGAIEATVRVPSSQLGTHFIKVTDGYVWVEESFNLTKTITDLDRAIAAIVNFQYLIIILVAIAVIVSFVVLYRVHKRLYTPGEIPPPT
ncbi:MAG: hypothetical protein H3Z51_03130, partial [archaeon]|nr:hypothetical protein [archaeon]